MPGSRGVAEAHSGQAHRSSKPIIYSLENATGRTRGEQPNLADGSCGSTGLVSDRRQERFS